METNDNGVKKTEDAILTGEPAKEAEHDPRQYPPGYTVTDGDLKVSGRKKAKGGKYGVEEWVPSALAPFIYLALGFFFGWWAWGWIVMPICGIWSARMKLWIKIVSISPFIYLLFGFFFGWWAWGWIIIPVSAILSQGMYRKA